MHPSRRRPKRQSWAAATDYHFRRRLGRIPCQAIPSFRPGWTS